MKTILALIIKDLRLDWKSPWTILLFTSLPLLMTALMAVIFGGHSGSASLPTIRVAILDQDNDLLSHLLRSLPAQGDAAKQLRLQFVESREDGVRVLEKRQASAFVILPRSMTERLLNSQTNTIELYENPAEQVLPKVVRQAVFLLAAGLSGAAEVLHEPLHDIRQLTRTNDFPAEAAVVAAASHSIKNMRQLKTYLFPPLVQFKTVPAADYVITPTQPPSSQP